MSAGREQAREAAVKGATATTYTARQHAADTASNYWEPIVKDLLAVVHDPDIADQLMVIRNTKVRDAINTVYDRCDTDAGIHTTPHKGCILR